jgi:small subunit ribosomal protein S16
MRSNSKFDLYFSAFARPLRRARWSIKPLLKIRLRRTGAKKQPSYRVVVAESTAPRDGTFLEILGHYNPLTNPATFQVKEERVKDWLQRGALPTDRVERLLKQQGILSA